MDKVVLSPQPIRSPLSSIINISNPTSEETHPEDDVYNASPMASNRSIQGSNSIEFESENDPPQVEEAREVRLSCPEVNQVNIRASRCLSLDLHYSTHLDSIAEVINDTNTGNNPRKQRSHSLDDVRVLQTSSSNDGANHLSQTNQYPTQPILDPPARTPTPAGIPTFGTAGASRYRIPSPPRSLCERLSTRPSPERLSWIRSTSSLPPGAIIRADNGTMVMGIWHNPRSDHTGSGRRGFTPTRDPFDHPHPLGMHPMQRQANNDQDLESARTCQEKLEIKPIRKA